MKSRDFVVGLLLLLSMTGCGREAVRPDTNASVRPTRLIPGTTLGKEVFPDGDTQQGGQGQIVDGIPCGMESHAQVAYHIHAHVSLFVNGEQIAIPLGLGIGNAGDNRACFYWIHTHDATGIVHLEAPTATNFTLGQFFDVWGQPLSATNVAGFHGTVTAHVNGTRYQGDVRAISFASHMEITLQVGTPVVSPPTYIFPDGF